MSSFYTHNIDPSLNHNEQRRRKRSGLDRTKRDGSDESNVVVKGSKKACLDLMR